MEKANKTIEELINKTKFVKHYNNDDSSVNAILGVDEKNSPITFKFNDQRSTIALFGRSGMGKTVIIYDMVYSILSQTNPSKLRIALINGKGSSFDLVEHSGKYYNPFLYAPTANASEDIEYARSLIANIVDVYHQRMKLFKENDVTTFNEYNLLPNVKPLPVIWLIIDEFSAITWRDRELTVRQMNKSVKNNLEFLVKACRESGIRILLSNQSVSSNVVSNQILPNIWNRISLGLVNYRESEKVFENANINLSLIDEPGLFYTNITSNSLGQIRKGKAMFLNCQLINKLNKELSKQFPNYNYVKTREEILEEK